jgi:hypothetical protein
MSEQHGLAAFGYQDVDDLTVLIDRPVQIGPATSDLDIRLVNRPSCPIARRAGRAVSINSE